MSQQEPNVEPEAFDTARAEVEIAFTDITDVTDRDARCLSFLSSVWVTPRDAARLTGIIGEYNGFDPLYMSEEGVWEEIADADPTARDPHSMCKHDSPVVPVSDYPQPRDGAAVVRAWWD